MRVRLSIATLVVVLLPIRVSLADGATSPVSANPLTEFSLNSQLLCLRQPTVDAS